MPPVGRPRSLTDAGVRAPTNEVGVQDLMAVGSNIDIGRSSLVNWTQLADIHEYVPELMWPQSIPMYDQMRTDSQLAALWTAVAWSVSQLRYVVDPNGCPDSMVAEISADLNVPVKGEDAANKPRMKKRFSHNKNLLTSLLALMYGHMYFEQVGTIIDGKWRLRKLAPRMPHTIQQFNVARDGALISIRQYPIPGEMNPDQPGLGPEISMDRMVGFVFQQEGMNWFGRSMFRDCYKNWLIKDRLMRVDAQNHERAGGIPYAEGAPGMSSPELEELNLLMQQFRTGDMAGLALPSGAKLNIAKGTGSDVVESWRAHDEAMARRFMLMLMNLAQGGQHVGSYGMAESFQDTWFIGMRVIAQWYCDTMTEYMIEDIVDWNYGEDTELAPVLTWEQTSEDALTTDALATMVRDKVIVMDDELEDWVRYRNHMPRRTQSREDALRTETEATNPPAAEDTGAGAAQGAPSRSRPAPTQASHGMTWGGTWRKGDPQNFLDGPPDVMASAPALVTVPNVTIMEAGIEYALSTGPTTFTPEDLRDAVTAANEDFSIPNPRLKIGHIDPRYNSTEYDGTPAFGRATNLRLSDNGMAVLADYVGVPKWLAELMPAAYPTCSVEGFWNVKSHAGKQWRFVLSAVAMLGVRWPGITTLEDLPMYYGEEMPADVEVDEDVVAATGGDPMKTSASANLDDIRRAFYMEYVSGVPEYSQWWVRAVLTDPNQLVVEDDTDGQLYLLPFKSNGKGEVKFGDPEPVRVDYVPDESRKAAAAHICATLTVGREVAVSFATRAESEASDDSPETTGGSMDPKEIRKSLGLPEDATREQVQEKLAALAVAEGLTTPVVPGNNTVQVDPATGITPAATGGAEPEDPDNPPQPTPDPQRLGSGQHVPGVPALAAGVPEGMALIDEGTLKTLQEGAEAGIALRNANLEAEQQRVVAAAISDGKIPPARRDHWMKLAKADLEGTKQTLASLEAVIPVAMREVGTGQTGEDTALHAQAETVQGWTDHLFPDVGARRQLEQQVAASFGRAYPRIMTDADPFLRGQDIPTSAFTGGGS